MAKKKNFKPAKGVAGKSTRVSLRDEHQKDRDSRMNKVLIYGIHAVDTAIRNDPGNIHQIWVDTQSKNSRLQRLLLKVYRETLPVHPATSEELAARAKTSNHQGIIAEYTDSITYDSAFLFKRLKDLDEPPFLLILDGVTDPHNLGACLRSAECAGVHAVIAPKDNSASLTPTARKVASGAAEVLPFIQVTNLNRTLNQLKKEGIWLIGTSDKASQGIHTTDLKGPLALVMGAEGKGLRRLTEDSCDIIASIPMSGKVSSLNISVATGVCLFEAVRQRSL